MWSLYLNCDFEPLLRPSAIAAASRLCLVALGRLGRDMLGIGGYGRRILNDTASDGESLYFELLLKLIPVRSVLHGLSQVFTEQPDRRPIRNGLRVSNEMAKRDPIYCMTFIRIRQTIPLLEHQQPDHENDVTVRKTASALGVGVEVRGGWKVSQSIRPLISPNRSPRAAKLADSCQIAKLVNVLIGKNVERLL